MGIKTSAFLWVGVGLFAVASFAVVSAMPPEDKVVVLDIGQGDSVLVQDNTNQVVIDGGPGATVLQRLSEEMPAFDKTIEVLVLTHPQQDHMEGLLHIIEQYNVGLVVLPKAAAESQIFQRFIALIEEHRIPYRFAWAGQQLLLGDAVIHILGPLDTTQARAATHVDLNNASTITRVDFHGMSFMLTGDAEQPAEHLLVQSTDSSLLNVDVLKAGHHGSRSSTSPEFLAATSPSAVVISVGKDNQFGHPHKETLDKIAQLPVWRTDQIGSIRFLWNPATGWLAPQ